MKEHHDNEAEFSIAFEGYAQIKEIENKIAELTKKDCCSITEIQIQDELIERLEQEQRAIKAQLAVNTMSEKTVVVENRMSPGELSVTVDEVNENVVVFMRDGKQTKYTRRDIVGKGIVTWDLLVAFARGKGSLEGNRAADVKKMNTGGNRKNLGEKLMAVMGLSKPPFIIGRGGATCFRSIQLRSHNASPDAMERITEEYIEGQGVDAD